MKKANFKLQQILEKLYNLKALHMIEEYSSYLLEDGYLNEQHMNIIRNQVCPKYLRKITPDQLIS